AVYRVRGGGSHRISAASGPVLRGVGVDQVVPGGLEDAAVSLQVGGVTVAVEGEEDAAGELVGELLGPLVGRRRVAGGSDDEDGRGALGGEGFRFVVGLDGPVDAGNAAPDDQGAEAGGDLLGLGGGIGVGVEVLGVGLVD